MTVKAFREKEYDPLQTLRDRLRTLEQRTEETETRIAMTDRRIEKLIGWRERRQRYLQLRGFRNQAIRALVALDRLSFDEIGQAFSISRQRVEQIAKRPVERGRKRGRPRKQPDGRGP